MHKSKNHPFLKFLTVSVLMTNCRSAPSSVGVKIWWNSYKPNKKCVWLASPCWPHSAHSGEPLTRANRMSLAHSWWHHAPPGPAPSDPSHKQGTGGWPGWAHGWCKSYSNIPRPNRGRPREANSAPVNRINRNTLKTSLNFQSLTSPKKKTHFATEQVPFPDGKYRNSSLIDFLFKTAISAAFCKPQLLVHVPLSAVFQAICLKGLSNVR